jgi:ectoine hydroxylase-related dioxygenase (phytanoyl-CoA dioxygenase family)
MGTGVAELAEDLERCWRRVCSLGLEKNVAELHALGYTTVSGALATGEVTEARDRILELAEKAGAARDNYQTYQSGLSFELYHLVRQGRIFEQLLLNPTALALGYYLLGENMLLNNSLAYVKGRTSEHLRMHCDTLMVPDPLPEYLHLVNFTFALTDYTLDGGCIGILPGSHRYRRHPTAHEATDYSAMRPIECPAGSLIVIPGNTWHGAFPKTTDGLRVTLVQAYCRMYLAPYVTHQIDREVLERNPPEFRRLLGERLWMGFDERGLDLGKFAPAYRAQRSHFA